MTVAVAVKSKLVGTGNVLTGLSGMTGVIVSYSPDRNKPREEVYGGDIDATTPLSAMAGGAGNRVKREENISLDLIIRITVEGQPTTEQSDARAAAIATIIANYIGANPKLDNSITGLLMVRVDGIRVPGAVNDDGTQSIAVLTLGIHSLLT